MRFTPARTLLCVSAAFWLLLAVACNKEPLEMITPPPPVAVLDTTFTMNNPVDQEKLLTLINEVRAKGCNCGDTVMGPVGPVTWNRALERAAYLHGKDMESGNYFAHNDKEGKDAGYRISRMGYPWLAWGENIALGILNETTVVRGWTRSPVHCKVLMNAKFTEMGVAKVGNFWAQEFGTRKSSSF